MLARWSSKQNKLHSNAFVAGGHASHGGRQWAPRKKFYPWPTLFKTGKLKASVSFKLSGLRVRFFASSPHAVFHQFGTRTMVVRKVIDVTNSDVSTLKRMIKELNGITVTTK